MERGLASLQVAQMVPQFDLRTARPRGRLDALGAALPPLSKFEKFFPGLVCLI